MIRGQRVIQGVSGISEITGDFSLDVMYSEIWQDPRLSFKHLNVCATNITLKVGTVISEFLILEASLHKPSILRTVLGVAYYRMTCRIRRSQTKFFLIPPKLAVGLPQENLDP